MSNWTATGRVSMGDDHPPIVNKVASGPWLWCWLVGGIYRLHAPGAVVVLVRV